MSILMKVLLSISIIILIYLADKIQDKINKYRGNVYITTHKFLKFGICRIGIIRAIQIGWFSLCWFDDSD